jgi:hypothetical protein
LIAAVLLKIEKIQYKKFGICNLFRISILVFSIYFGGYYGWILQDSGRNSRFLFKCLVCDVALGSFLPPNTGANHHLRAIDAGNDYLMAGRRAAGGGGEKPLALKPES